MSALGELMRAFACLILCVSAISGCGTDCEKSDRSGTYYVAYNEVSGDCGPIDDTYIEFEDGEAVGVDITGCSSTNTWSSDACSVETTGSCADYENGLAIGVAGETTQEDDDGDKISGTLSIAIKDLNTGADLCASSYEVSYKKN